MYTQNSDHFVNSLIVIDLPHNQNIAVIKAYRGTIGLTEDKYKAFFLSLSSNTS